MLVGDVAGFLHPVLGEGISPAMRSGIFAAETVKEALDKDDPSLLNKIQGEMVGELWERLLRLRRQAS